MLDFNVIRDAEGNIQHIETSAESHALLRLAKLNKGCAFTFAERETFNLQGLLPQQIETLELQAMRMYAQYGEHKTNIGKNIYLNVLHDYNETLFYKLVSDHLEEMLPIIYTPTVGDAVERFSLEHRKPRGLYLSYPERHRMEQILANRLPPEVDLIVVTDGEAVLGIGDQGIGGINISNAKLMVYTLCGGINPHRVLPIQLDVGTNNAALLADPMYLGWRHERVHGPEYDEFIATFVKTVQRMFPHVFLHWEDFGRDNARRILTQYREKLCTFNGDIQGTGAIALACVLAGAKGNGIPLIQQRVVILGAGTAGVGIADQITAAMQREGLSKAAAHAQCWLVDKQGLLTSNQMLLDFQTPYGRDLAEISAWDLLDPNTITLYDVVKNVRPTILIGCSTVKGAFTEEIVKLMASFVERPIIMPLSNPTAKAEATPEDLINWTAGKVIVATGSPFPAVNYQQQLRPIAQSNNAFAFPGIGLGAIAVHARQVTDGMLWAATQTLSACSPINTSATAALLPRLSDTREVSFKVAHAVAATALAEGVADCEKNVNLDYAINSVRWKPQYYPYVKK